MAKNIFVIVNSYDDCDGMSVATDGGAYSTFEKAKKKLIEYLHEIWDFRKDFFDTEEDYNEWLNSCFQNEEKSVWVYNDGESISDISVHQVTFNE